MQDYQERVIAKKSELDDRIEKLKSFFITETFDNLKFDEQLRMKDQISYMASHSRILGERIAAFTD